jgi:hypothetical protein
MDRPFKIQIRIIHIVAPIIEIRGVAVMVHDRHAPGNQNIFTDRHVTCADNIGIADKTTGANSNPGALSLTNYAPLENAMITEPYV